MVKVKVQGSRSRSNVAGDKVKGQGCSSSSNVTGVKVKGRKSSSHGQGHRAMVKVDRGLPVTDFSQ